MSRRRFPWYAPFAVPGLVFGSALLSEGFGGAVKVFLIYGMWAVVCISLMLALIFAVNLFCRLVEESK